MRQIKLKILRLMKILGLFEICKHIYKNHLRVLCYHGFSYHDEHLFKPRLFITKETFAQRMKFLSESGYTVTTLDNAIDRPSSNQLVLTMDDAWAGTTEVVGDILSAYKLPFMLYVTSYYAEKQIPVLNVAMSYVLWKTTHRRLSYAYKQDDDLKFQLDVELDKQNYISQSREICQQLEKIPDAADRAIVLNDIATSLDVSLLFEGKPLFRLLTKNELAELQKINFDLQLHTHRHQSPLNEAMFEKEIRENREWMSTLMDPSSLIHFCFPSGLYQDAHFNVLAKHVKTATTTDIGLNAPGFNPLKIRRILDGEDVELIELEAELCGFGDILRKITRRN